MDIRSASDEERLTEITPPQSSRSWKTTRALTALTCTAVFVAGATVALIGLGRRGSATTLTLDAMNHVESIAADRPGPRAPWDYRRFHLGVWPYEGYPLCEGLPDPNYAHNEWQSPIDIPVNEVNGPTSDDTLALIAEAGGCKVYTQLKNPHTYETVFVPECTNLKVTWKNKVYTLQQFHFHSESETLFNGNRFDGEMHLVHKSQDGLYLVIGIFLSKSGVPCANHFLRKMFHEEGYTANRQVENEEPINPYSTLTSVGSKFYSYPGSFTTPPCTPGVEWISMVDPIIVLGSDWNRFRKFLKNSEQTDAYGHNFRPAQPLNNRPISVGSVGSIALDGGA